MIETFWRILIVVICLSWMTTNSPTFNESLFMSRLIAFSGIYYMLIPFIDEIKIIIKDKRLFKSKDNKSLKGEKKK